MRAGTPRTGFARVAGTPPAARSSAFRPHPLADPVKLRVSAH